MSDTQKDQEAGPHEGREAARPEKGESVVARSRRRPFLFVGAGLGVVALSAAAVFVLKQKHPSNPSEAPAAGATAHADADRDVHAFDPGSPEVHVPSWARPLQNAWHDVRDKAEVIREALEENRRLRLENANLRVQVETVRMDCRLQDAAEKTAAAGAALEMQTGERVGRMPASIKYRPPTHLLPPQLYTLATSYFRAEDFEKAAVILTLLTDMDENAAYRNAKNLVMLGVAWLRVENPRLADEAFTRALDEPERAENLSYQAQARLWKALLAERQGKGTKTQFWLRELVDHHPRSIEASWVNSSARMPASAPVSPVEAGGAGHHDDHSSQPGH